MQPMQNEGGIAVKSKVAAFGVRDEHGHEEWFDATNVIAVVFTNDHVPEKPVTKCATKAVGPVCVWNGDEWICK